MQSIAGPIYVYAICSLPLKERILQESSIKMNGSVNVRVRKPLCL